MIYAYDEMYIEGAMIRMGDMMEYACMDCGYDPDSFFKMFIQSGFARRFEIGDVSIVAGKSGPELAYMVMATIDYTEKMVKPLWREDRSDIYWSGWVLAYYQWYTSRPFYDIYKDISIRTMQKLYPTLHETDIMKTVDVLANLQEKKKKKNTISNLRLVRGMTQQELAERAHMSVSQLQRLEYGERKVENMSLKSALELARALGVSVEELE